MLTKKHPRLHTGGISNEDSGTDNIITSGGLAASIEPLGTIESWSLALVVSVPTIERLRRAGKIPPPDVMIGRLPRWKPSTIRAWIESGGGQ